MFDPVGGYKCINGNLHNRSCSALGNTLQQFDIFQAMRGQHHDIRGSCRYPATAMIQHVPMPV